MSGDAEARERFLTTVRAQARHAREPRGFDRAALAVDDRLAALRRAVAIVSMGNAAEAHGPAIAPDIDDRVAQHVAVAVANRTGARYLGHCPYATDRLGGLATVWSPVCAPVDQFVERVGAYLASVLAHVERPRWLWLLSGHGGNGAIVPHLDELAARLALDGCRYELALRVPATLPHLNVQHAGPGEHAVARALGPGCFDDEAHAALQVALGADLEAALKDAPAIGGFAGYYLYGDARFEPMRDRYPGVKPAVAELVATRALPAEAEAGAAILAHTVATLAADVEAAFAVSAAFLDETAR